MRVGKRFSICHDNEGVYAFNLCIGCYRLLNRQKNKKKINQRQRTAYKNNIDIMRKYHKIYHKMNPEKAFAKRIKWLYGITVIKC